MGDANKIGAQDTGLSIQMVTATGQHALHSTICRVVPATKTRAPRKRTCTPMGDVNQTHVRRTTISTRMDDADKSHAQSATGSTQGAGVS